MAALIEALGAHTRAAPAAGPRPFPIDPVPPGPLDTSTLAHGLRRAAEGRLVSLAHLPLSWDGACWPFRHPLDYLGAEGGAGIGSGLAPADQVINPSAGSIWRITAASSG